MRTRTRAPARLDRSGHPLRPRLLAIVTIATLTIAPSIVAPTHGAQPAPECPDWQQCRQLALDARASGQYERFHDLAWRTVQKGPANDTALMYLLARAQSLSGRPHDALVMLGRLTEKGFVGDATTEEDLDRVRQLPGWQDVAALMDRVSKGNTVVAPVPPPAPVSAARSEPRPAEEVSRFSAKPFVAGGLAYDAVSRRMLFGDALGRRVIVLGEGLDTTVDLVREASAQFHDVTALEIDAKRGDLWVASTARGGESGAIHRLQLISGRPIAIIELPSTFQTVRLIDLAIAANGTILVLDSARPRVIGLRPGTKTAEQLMSLDISAPASIAAAGDERIAYVAHRNGIIRLDLQLQSAAAVSAPDGIALGGFERIRWHRNALVGVQVLPDGSRHIVRLRLDRGRAVTDATVLEASLSGDAGPTFASVSGDDVYYLVTQGGTSSTAPGAMVMNVVVRRIRLP